MDDMDPKDLYWLAGLLEGEGSFMAPLPSSPRRPIISLSMTDEDVVARVAILFGQSYCAHRDGRSEDRGWKTPYGTKLRGLPAVKLMRLLRPLMGKRRQEQIDRALAGYCEPRSRSITDRDARALAARYWAGERRRNDLAKEFGISRNLVHYYVHKYKPADVAQQDGARAS